MNILVTGSNGFIGKNFILKFKKKYKILSLKRKNTYSFKRNQITCDLLKKKHLNLFLKEKLNIDVILHTASILATTTNLHDTALIKQNLLIYESLVKIINKFNPKQVINLSSIAVYPNKDGIFNEFSEIKPSINSEGMYGISKFIGENVLDFKCKKTKILNLRLAQVYGPGMRKDRIFELMKTELKKKNYISVHGLGQRVSAFIHIESLISKIELCIKKELEGVFNIADQNLSYKQLAKKIIYKFGNKKSKIKLLNIGVCSKSYINFNKFKKILKKNELFYL